MIETVYKKNMLNKVEILKTMGKASSRRVSLITMC